MKKTPLYENHIKWGGKIIDFGGWALPVQYKGIIDEHNQVRSHAGLFDVSHMGEVRVTGEDAEKYLQRMVTKDISKAAAGQAIYTPMCYEDGGVVDDLLIYKLSDEEYLLVVNAANTDKDFDWLLQHVDGDVTVVNESADYAQLALQGPKAEEILQRLTDKPLNDIRFYRFDANVDVAGIPAIVSRTGYTGEDGFELYVKSEFASELWEKLLETGKDDGLMPIGLGARDTLRFEVALPLYGNELAKDITPLEAGIGFFVSLDKDFIGKEVLSKQKKEGVRRKIVGFEMVGRGIARSHQTVEIDGEEVGFVTSGSFAPSLKKNMGLALIKKEYAEIGTKLDIMIRSKPVKAAVVKKPFYNKKYQK